MPETTHSLPPGTGTDRVIVPDAEPDTLAAAAVALANTNGGLIVCAAPVTPDARAAATARSNPPVSIGAPQPVPNQNAYACPVTRSDRVHALPDGRVMVCAGTRSRELNGDEIRRLLSARRAGDFEREPVPGAGIDDLDYALVAEFLHKRQAHTGGNGYTPEALLGQVGVLTARGGVTVAGLLLFGRDPARWLPDAGARFVRVVGGQPALDQALDGPLLRVLETLRDLLRDHIPASNPPGYPASVLHEALFNAVCHRDYRLRGERLTVTLYPDYLEITSPGGLPGYLLSTQHMLGARYRRNPTLQWTLAQWQAPDATARGVLGMIIALDQHGSRPPQFESGPYHVTVRLYSTRAHASQPPEPSPPPPTAELTPRQRDILDYARARGSITLREVRIHCDNASAAHLQADLDALVSAGHLRKIGARRNAYYILGA